jgi:SAM-dependent methyltransferase
VAGPLENLFRARLEAVEDPALRSEWRTYLGYHARRYDVLLRVVLGLVGAGDAPRILNVGPMFETALLRERVRGATVDTLGFSPALFPPGPAERHLELDLNRAGDPSAPAGDGSYDAIVMGEVIEHLHTAPSIVLGYLAGWLRPGGVLVLQTPNAVALHKRVRMLAGRNPLEPIRESTDNPGHFHEYALGELRAAGERAGLTMEGWETANYFGTTPAARAYAAVGRLLPASLRHGITMWLRRPTG